MQSTGLSTISKLSDSDFSTELLEVAHTTASATLSRFTYALDPAGDRSAMTTREGTVTYRYDELHRLTEACWSPTSCPGGPPATPVTCLGCLGGLLTRPAATTTPPPGETYRTYTYDPVGNRLTEVSNAGTTTSAYDNADRLSTVTPPGGGPISYTFDNNGNQTAAGGMTFTYDYADRLKSATVGGTTETYAYAGDGLRLSALTGAAPSQTTQSGWDRVFGLPQLVLERDGSGALLRSYRYGLDLLSQTAGATTYTYHPDGLGSVADVTSSAGASLTWSEFYPYGQVRLAGTGAGAPAANPFAFSGEQRDGLTGLYHLRARQYDPGTGRFLTTDPARTTDLLVSMYPYAGDNPITYVDPSGRITVGMCFSFGFTAMVLGWGGSLCLVISQGGQAGVIATGGAGARFGAEVGGGIDLHVSNADYLEDLRGPFFEVGGGGDFGGGAEGTVFSGFGRCRQTVVGGTAGLTVGAGGEVHGLMTVTEVVGFIGSPAPPCPGGTSK